MSRNMTIVPIAAYLDAQHHTAATTVTGDAVDTFNLYEGHPARYAVMLCTGTVADGSVSIRLEHSDDGSTWETAKMQSGADASVELNANTPRRHSKRFGGQAVYPIGCRSERGDGNHGCYLFGYGLAGYGCFVTIRRCKHG